MFKKLPLDISQWEKFKISELFNVRGTKTTEINLLKEYGNGIYPYVTTQSSNNGVEGFYDYWTEQGGVIVIDSAVAGFCSYQDKNFSASDHVEKLIPFVPINKYIGLFIATIINLNRYKYNYGRKSNQKNIRETIIKLPISKKTDIDWRFMENYIRSLFDHSRIETKIEKKNLPLNISKWKKFKMIDIFEDCINGRRLIKEDREPGNVRYFSASKFNNAMTDSISNPLFIERDALIYTTFGDCFFVEGEFTASDEITIFKHSRLNKYNGLFIATIISANKYRYQFGRKAFFNKFENEIIKLPINNYGEIDWLFMENHMKSLPYSDKI